MAAYTSETSRQVIVIGAGVCQIVSRVWACVTVLMRDVLNIGVIGLTTALKLQEQGGYQITIVAETLPSDPKNIRYTSPWAGAHHVSSAGHDKRLQSE
jgi:hypothetical protein